MGEWQRWRPCSRHQPSSTLSSLFPRCMPSVMSTEMDVMERVGHTQVRLPQAGFSEVQTARTYRHCRSQSHFGYAWGRIKVGRFRVLPQSPLSPEAVASVCFVSSVPRSGPELQCFSSLVKVSLVALVRRMGLPRPLALGVQRFCWQVGALPGPLRASFSVLWSPVSVKLHLQTVTP